MSENIEISLYIGIQIHNLDKFVGSSHEEITTNVRKLVDNFIDKHRKKHTYHQLEINQSLNQLYQHFHIHNKGIIYVLNSYPPTRKLGIILESLNDGL